ncbi:imidazole glycerol phosphate synthase [Pseudomonas syringae]|uniref:imidazole glycerol phosphate synthase n=1 Tax=Pseudomonas syringae TaxID=317 RepID=UPI001F115BE5|nr:imidazole glycerol phosphate synthase [Pseudomonas syringae]MCH5512553.1 imidazole glycerol phosphate synthase [Pseudomonas syringae pv. syringae]MCH5625929.1 imidazole glycerol phosphate synthase [Pseudomonas syringae pv. syringae]
MAGYSAESLLAWMKNTTRLRGWDAIIALDGDKVNELLEHVYQQGVAQGLSRPVPDGSITIPDTHDAHFFSGCVLGAPTLSFKDSVLGHSLLAWRLPVIAGMHTVVESAQGQHNVHRIAAYDPLNAPDLDFDLELNSQSADLVVELGLAKNLSLDFPGGSTERSKIGEFFQGWLSNPENQEQRLRLGIFNEQSNELLNVRRIDVRSQLESPDAVSVHKKGALLLFTTLEYGVTGGIPDGDSDFRYLIPNDAQHSYSATAVFSSHALHRAAFGGAVIQMLQAPDFSFIVPEDKPLQRMVAQAGTFAVPAGDYRSAEFVFESEPFSVQAFNAQHPLTIDFEYAQTTQTWEFPCTLGFRYRALDSDQWQSHNATFNISLKHEFHLIESESDDQAVEGHLYAPYLFDHEVSAVPGTLDNLSARELEQINGFVAYTVKHALLQGLSKTLDATGAERFLAGWSLPDEQVLQPVLKRLPYDLALFGRIDPAASTFSIVEQQALISTGEALQLTTRPARPGIVWSLANPLDGGTEGLGEIDAQGRYVAPAALPVRQGFQRVLIKAMDPVSGHGSTAVLTVLTSSVSVSPLIQVCNYGQRIALSARSSRAGNLKWTVVDPVPGQSGTLEDGVDAPHEKFYVAGAGGAGNTYVLDTITVSDDQHTESIQVLVLRHSPMLPITLASVNDQRAELTVVVNGHKLPVTWRLSGPGSIDAAGVYSSDSNAPERFVVVFAEIMDEYLGTMAGHLILPLPLSGSSGVLQALTGPALGTAGNTMPRSLSAIVQQAGAGTLTQGWGAVAAVSRSDLNRHIEQQYIERYRELAFLPLFTGEIVVDERQGDTVRLKQVVLGVPVLSFVADSAGSSSVLVTMNIVSGRYSGLHQPQGSATTVSGSFIISEPMGFRLAMTVDLFVGEEGHVLLDLADGAGVACNLGGVDDAINQALADFFAREFKQIALHCRVFSVLQAQLNRYHVQTPTRLRLLTRAAPRSSDARMDNAGDGALMLFMQAQDSEAEGLFPSADNFVYPIPDDRGADSQPAYGTVLMLSQETQSMIERERLQVLDSLKFSGGRVFEPLERHCPHDLLLFGSLRSTQASITPLFSTVTAGQTQRFVLHNPQGEEIPATSWSALSIQSHVAAGSGSISSSGVYTAAGLEAIGHDALRVVITAVYQESGAVVKVSALVSVVSRSLELAPRVTVVPGGTALQPVSLAASTHDGSPVSWALLGAELGRLSEVGKGALFSPDARSGKRALAVQQIEASGNDLGIATVLVANGQQMLHIEPAFVPRARPKVAVQLQDDRSLLPGLERRWKVVGGAGTVDRQGLFMPPDQALVASSVVSCEVVNNGVVLACGYSVIELSEVIDEGTWTELSMFTITVPGSPSTENNTGILYPNGYQQLRLQIKTQVMPVDGVDYELSPAERLTMRLVDDGTQQEIETVALHLDGMSEDDEQTWRVRSQHNRFELSGAGVFAAEPGLDASRPVVQDFYLHSRQESGSVSVFYARFQDANDNWWNSVRYEEVNSTVEITPRRLPSFDNQNYNFIPQRAEGLGGNPPAEPPAEGAQDDPFDFNLNTIDYWKLSVVNPDTQQWVGFERLKFMPSKPGSDVINTSIILWESEQVEEKMFSWTGFIFDDPEVIGDVSKVHFDEALKDVMGADHSLDIDVNMQLFETGKLIISLHRLRGLKFIPKGHPARDKLTGTLAVLLIDKQGNAHKRRISFLAEGPGRRNRLMHTFYSATRSE